MAGYVFENMSDQDAAAFGDNDILLFRTATANQVNVQPYSNGSSGSLGNSGITLSFGGISHTFGTSISTASQNGNVVFNDASHLVIGTQAAETGGGALTPQGNTAAAGGANAGQFVDPNTVYALGGADTINFGNSSAGVSNYLNGGFGADTINGGNANNHIFGNSQFSQPGDVDPGSHIPDAGDQITVGSGTNYIQGNAGADTITVGTAAVAATPGQPGGNGQPAVPGTAAVPGSTGDNRVFGGADADSITIRGAGLNQVNGNTGNDTITAATATGDNTLRGGQGDDSISGGTGHDVLSGDIGSDTLVVHGDTAATAGTAHQGHISQLIGGQGADLFDFSAAGAGTASTFSGSSTSGGASGQTYYQTITDFTVGEDHITINGTQPTGQTSQVGHSGTVFSSVHDAEIFAQTQLNPPNGTPSVVSALSVGTASQHDTYLFYNDANGGDPTSGNNAAQGLGIIHLAGVTDATTINNGSFQTPAPAMGGGM